MNDLDELFESAGAVSAGVDRHCVRAVELLGESRPQGGAGEFVFPHDVRRLVVAAQQELAAAVAAIDGARWPAPANYEQRLRDRGGRKQAGR